jgi:hypothetical protein
MRNIILTLLFCTSLIVAGSYFNQKRLNNYTQDLRADIVISGLENQNDITSSITFDSQIGSSFDTVDTYHRVGKEIVYVHDYDEYIGSYTIKISGIDIDAARMIEIDGSFLLTDGDRIFLKGYELKGALPSELESLGGSYYSDGVSVYYEHKKIEGADPETFTLEYNTRIEPKNLEEVRYVSGYSFDVNNIYFKNENIGSVVGYQKLSDLYRKNSEDVFFLNQFCEDGGIGTNQIIEEADLDSFELLRSSSKGEYDYDYPYVAFDKNNVYEGFSAVKGSDPQTLKVSSDSEAKDSQNAYGLVRDTRC